MDLLLMPLLLVAGLALVVVGINGLPSATVAPVSEAAVVRPFPGRRQFLDRTWLLRPGHERVAPMVTQASVVSYGARPSGLDAADILLNDVLSEMIEVRRELAELRARIESLGALGPAAASIKPELTLAASTPGAAETPSRRRAKRGTVSDPTLEDGPSE